MLYLCNVLKEHVKNTNFTGLGLYVNKLLFFPVKSRVKILLITLFPNFSINACYVRMWSKIKSNRHLLGGKCAVPAAVHIFDR